MMIVDESLRSSLSFLDHDPILGKPGNHYPHMPHVNDFGPNLQ